MTKRKNAFSIRVYDVATLDSIEELLKTKLFSSTNELLSKALTIGIERIYLELGKKKQLTKPLPSEPSKENERGIELRMEALQKMLEDVFVLSNAIDATTACLLNIEIAKLDGESVNGELIDSGYFTKSPGAIQAIKDNLTSRLTSKKR